MNSETKSKQKKHLQSQAAFLRRKMRLSRAIGILCCMFAIACIILYYLKTISEWLCIINIAYCAGTIFVANSFLQDIKVGNPWQRINAICGILMYAFSIFLIVWGFKEGLLSTRF